MRFFLALSLAALLLVSACKEPSKPAEADSIPPEFIDSVSYVLGFQAGSVHRLDTLDIDPEIYMRGMIDGAAADSAMDAERMEDLMARFEVDLRGKREARAEVERKELEKKTEKAKAEGSAYIEKIKDKPGVKETSTGLLYEVIKPGTGGSFSQEKNWVDFDAKIYLVDGTLLDDTREMEQDNRAPVEALPPGMREALMTMKEGAIWKIHMKPSLAFGDIASPDPRIPPGSTIVMEIELYEFIPEPEEIRKMREQYEKAMKEGAMQQPMPGQPPMQPRPRQEPPEAE